MDTSWKLLKSRYVKKTIESKTKRITGGEKERRKKECVVEKKKEKERVRTNRGDKAQQVERGINKITKERT